MTTRARESWDQDELGQTTERPAIGKLYAKGLGCSPNAIKHFNSAHHELDYIREYLDICTLPTFSTEQDRGRISHHIVWSFSRLLSLVAYRAT